MILAANLNPMGLYTYNNNKGSQIAVEEFLVSWQIQDGLAAGEIRETKKHSTSGRNSEN